MKKIFEPVTDANKDVSEDATRTKTENSKENNKALEKQLLEIMNDTGISAPYLLSPLKKLLILNILVNLNY